MDALQASFLLSRIAADSTSQQDKDQWSEELIRAFWTKAAEGDTQAGRVIDAVFELQHQRLHGGRR